MRTELPPLPPPKTEQTKALLERLGELCRQNQSRFTVTTGHAGCTLNIERVKPVFKLLATFSGTNLEEALEKAARSNLASRLS